MHTKIALTTLAVLAFTAQAATASDVPDSADKVQPLLIGAQVPAATVQTLDGQSVGLAQVFSKQPSIVIFYRGGW